MGLGLGSLSGWSQGDPTPKDW
ncbi:uncharacterized protein G2W53_031715 [Senna tora]|uniref:Uncharacterized protein n=1 Tax=Senna tora TaxID=362788 RepID=A0A834WB48_9FABA|nr:uncharacterized protein G2W53_031715 [Senna tora]